MLFDIHPLTSNEAAAYVPMTFPTREPLLHACDVDPHVIALGATFRGQPVGLALAEIANEGPGIVRTIYVAPDCRSFGVGLTLLARAEEALARRGATAARLTYLAGLATTPHWERILAHRGWNTPQIDMLHLRATTEITRAPWIRFTRLPAGMTAFPWSDLTDADRHEIDARQAAEGWIPPELVPWRWEAGYDPRCSLALRAHGRVIGWVITQPVGEDSIRFSDAWIDRAFQRGKVPPFLPLCIAAFRRAEATGDYRYGLFDFSSHQKPVFHFVQRWVVPYAESVRMTMVTSKELQAAPAVRMS